jgi:leucyl-tRNA synthetase
MEYNFNEIEKRWQKRWAEMKTYHVTEDTQKQKFYVLNMFPYPSGAGLHVGHPLGYIASDIYARYKRLKGFNVLNPMGYDAYGLPAEQYAIQTGQHPAVTTEQNINHYREQLDKIGFSFDWDREVRTCDPKYYHWTQWAFIRMFNSYYDNAQQKARPIEELEKRLAERGTEGLDAACSEELKLTAAEWNAMTEKQRRHTLMNWRLAYLGETMVNWCAGLGTVLANDEVVDGLSVRGGYPVVQKKMMQWCLRVSAYAQRLLDGLDTVDWTESLKETQRNWIGRSEGTEIEFKIAPHKLPKGGALEVTKEGDDTNGKTNQSSPSGECEGGCPSTGKADGAFTIFTTRADTIFGVTFMVLAPESELVPKVTTPEQKAEVDAYLERTKKRTERERISDRSVSGVFSGSYAVNPFTGEDIPIWISDYVLAGYGTGAIMAVPAHDSRDYAFAKHFGLEIRPLIEGCDVSEESFDAKEGTVCNSPKSGVEAIHGFSLNGLSVKEAIQKTKDFVKANNLGRVKVNYRLRDAIFSRQRYWGEPFPVYYKDGEPYMLPEDCLPLELPEIDQYKPTETGEPPLGHAKKWAWDTANRCVVDKSLVDNKTVFPLELNTMPGFAGSSAYYLRYMDPANGRALVSPEADRYWRNVDLYVGGTEHATGHLIYSRYWNKFLHDIGVSCEEEPFKKLVNQGMIQGRSNFVYRVNQQPPLNPPEGGCRNGDEGNQSSPLGGIEGGLFVSFGLKDKYDTTPIHVDVNIVHGDVLDIDAFKAWRPEYGNAEFIMEDGKYVCGWAIEKMSKSMYNVVNPDMIVEKYGADTLRLYEMFLGPVEQSKPWDTNGIDGCHRFLKKFWSLYCDKDGMKELAGGEATAEELKSVHKLIKKVTQDIEAFSYNTSVAAFMICVNELSQMKCRNRALLTDLVVLIAPSAPHIAEELWHALGNDTTVFDAAWPEYNEKFLVESTVSLTVSFNGKARFQMQFAADADNKTIEDTVLDDDRSKKYIGEKNVVKVIIVPKKIVNIVIK